MANHTCLGKRLPAGNCGSLRPREIHRFGSPQQAEQATPGGVQLTGTGFCPNRIVLRNPGQYKCVPLQAHQDTLPEGTGSCTTPPGRLQQTYCSGCRIAIAYVIRLPVS